MNMKLYALFLLILVTPALAVAVPTKLTHQGRIIESNNIPMGGNSNVTFSLYAGNSQVWTQTLAVTFDDGYYSVELGPGTPTLSTEIFDGSALDLSITVEGQDEFMPRSRINSVPYAMMAGAVTGEVNALEGLSVNGVQVIDGDGIFRAPGEITVSSTGLACNSQAVGSLRWENDRLEVCNGSAWQELAATGSGGDFSPPTISELDPAQIEPGTNEVITINGADFEDGCEIEFGEIISDSMTFNNSGQVTAETGELVSGAYTVRVVNPVGLRGLLIDGLVVDASPEWSTGAGDLGSVVDSQTGEHFTLEATDAEGQDLTYTVVSGNLPGGLSLDSNTGVISGDPDDVDDTTTFEFTVAVADTARDPNTVERTFSIDINDLIGAVQEVPGISCKHIFDIGSSLGSQLYWIDPNEGDTSDAFQVWCRMDGDYPGTALVLKKPGNISGQQNHSAELNLPCTPSTSGYCKLSDAKINQIKETSSQLDAYIVLSYKNSTGDPYCRSYARKTCQWISNGAAGSGCENSVVRNSGQYCSRNSNNTSYRGIDGYVCGNLNYPGIHDPNNPFVIFEHSGGSHYCGGWDTTWDHIELLIN